MPFYYVYLLQSKDLKHHYTGFTANLHERLAQHNAGQVPHTAKFRPWTLQTAVAFTQQERALSFERYLKSGSGRAFAKKHF